MDVSLPLLMVILSRDNVLCMWVCGFIDRSVKFISVSFRTDLRLSDKSILNKSVVFCLTINFLDKFHLVLITVSELQP